MFLSAFAASNAPRARADAPVSSPPSAAPLPMHPAALNEQEDPYRDPVSEQGQHARGLYYSADVVAVLGASNLIQIVKSARMNAVVIDLKDERGRVYFDSKLPELQHSKNGALGDVPALFRKLHEGGIYVIARMVCFSDPLLPRQYPDRAVHDSRPYKNNAIWGNWARHHPWLDPYNAKNHAMLVGLAKEIEALGADEIQLDYVRFPVDDATAWAAFPAQTNEPRDAVLLRMLEQMDRAVHIPLGADVFGLTTMPWHDASPLGQHLETWTQHIEVFSPMLYLHGMQAWHENDKENRAGRLIALGVSTLRGRIGELPVIRPYLQAFPQGADHYDAPFIAEQIGGARRSGADGFLFWHPASHYRIVRTATVGGPAERMLPFPASERAEARHHAWGVKH